jgi:hypothetical protein
MSLCQYRRLQQRNIEIMKKDSYEMVDSSHRSSQQCDVLGCIASDEVIDRIEGLIASVVEMMNGGKLPSTRLLGEKSIKRFTLSQSRSFTSILMVLSYCHSLLGHNRSATTREVYYFFVTHFRNQRECDSAIWESAELLGVPRMSLGLAASPKGRQRDTFIVNVVLVPPSRQTHNLNQTLRGTVLQVGSADPSRSSAKET